MPKGMQMRKLLMVGLFAALAACQTVPNKLGFSKQQVATLSAEGFKPVEENYELGLDDRVLFEVDKSELSGEALGILGRLTKVLLGVGIHGAGVEGHTDSTGSDDYNQALSERRAASVKAQIVSTGMAEPEVRAVGLGETQPVESNDTPEGRTENRRVVIVVTPVDAN
jgi:outer membrane protein OmpA-like peptidoglycan-associated protein